MQIILIKKIELTRIDEEKIVELTIALTDDAREEGAN